MFQICRLQKILTLFSAFYIQCVRPDPCDKYKYFASTCPKGCCFNTEYVYCCDEPGHDSFRYVALFLLKLIMIVWFLAFLIMVGVTLFKSLYRKFQPSLHYLFDTTSSPVSVITREIPYSMPSTNVYPLHERQLGNGNVNQVPQSLDLSARSMKPPPYFQAELAHTSYCTTGAQLQAQECKTDNGCLSVPIVNEASACVDPSFQPNLSANSVVRTTRESTGAQCNLPISNPVLNEQTANKT